MKDISFCILDNDPQYIKAFMSVVAADYAGCSVRARSVCDAGCSADVDACVSFGSYIDRVQRSCDKALLPACGRYGGVGAILREIKNFVTGKKPEQISYGKAMRNRPGTPAPLSPFDPGTLVCVYASAGGIGTSVSAIGIARELSRYRGEQVMYLSLEDLEDPGLYPADLGAMRSSEVLYRYFRASSSELAPDDVFARLFKSAAMRDEYGLFRFAPDDGLCSFAELAPEELYIFLSRITASLGLTRIVLDFGTRLHFLTAFAAGTDENETTMIKISSANKGSGQNADDGSVLTAAFTRCGEDIKTYRDETEIGLANTFGREVKELCDRIGGRFV